MYYIHKEFENKCIKNLTEGQINYYLNNGWEPGKCPVHWYTNGVKNRLIKEGKEIPYGFYPGQSLEYRLKNSEGGKRRWKNMRESEKLDLSNKISKTIKNFWDNISEDDKQKRELNRMLSRLNWTDEEKILYSRRMSDSAKKARQKLTPEDYKRISEKGFLTRKIRNNTNSSRIEDDFYNFLINIFSKYDVLRNYKDDLRYPFHCDFYIISYDLFIELNIHYTHGPHPFNPNNEEDIVLLDKIRSKQKIDSKGKKNSFFVFEDVWTIRDPLKLKYATDNSLSYIQLYSKTEVDEFKKYIVEKVLLYDY